MISKVFSWLRLFEHTIAAHVAGILEAREWTGRSTSSKT